MHELKTLSAEGVDAALRKADRYRLLNEPWLAESICRDVLRIDPDNETAVITLLLALGDQIRAEGMEHAGEARALADQLRDEYLRQYYTGLVHERRGFAHLGRRTFGSGSMAYAALTEAMAYYEKAEQLRPAGNDDALLRWNTCARTIMRHPELRPHVEDAVELPLE